jgi:hypothetical protein
LSFIGGYKREKNIEYAIEQYYKYATTKKGRNINENDIVAYQYQSLDCSSINWEANSISLLNRKQNIHKITLLLIINGAISEPMMTNVLLNYLFYKLIQIFGTFFCPAIKTINFPQPIEPRYIVSNTYSTQ